MNNRIISSIIAAIFLFGLFLQSSCAPTMVNATPSAVLPAPVTATPTQFALLTDHPRLIPVAQKPPREMIDPNLHLFYSTPEMDQVLLASELVYYKNLLVDIYYPPNFSFEEKLPIVILSNGASDGPTRSYKDIPYYIEWAKLIAAKGMIAVSSNAGLQPTESIYSLLNYLSVNADALGLDLRRIGFYSINFTAMSMFKVLQDESAPFRSSFKAGILNSPDPRSAGKPSNWPKHFAVFIVASLKDDPNYMQDVSKYASEARSLIRRVEYEELQVSGSFLHFDVRADTQETRDVIQKELDFLKTELLQ